MEILHTSVVAPGIAAAKAIVDAAKVNYDREVEAAQAECQHQIVSEMPWRSGGGAARRICNHCLLEEEGSHWSGGSVWSKHDHSGTPVLGNVEGRIVLPVDSDNFYKIRWMR